MIEVVLSDRQNYEILKMALQGQPHRVACPDGMCGSVFMNAHGAALHFTLVHAEKCLVCGAPACDIDDDHVTNCTMAVPVACQQCGESYQVSGERQHYLQHGMVIFFDNRHLM